MPALKIAIVCLVLFLAFYLWIKKRSRAGHRQDEEAIDDMKDDAEISDEPWQEGHTKDQWLEEEQVQESGELKEEMTQGAEAGELVEADEGATDEGSESESDDGLLQQDTKQEDESTSPNDGEAQPDESLSSEEKSVSIFKDDISSEEENGHDPTGDMVINDEKKGGGISNMPLIQAQVLIGEGSIQNMLESTVTLNLPAVKVKEIRAQVQELRADVIEDKVIIQAVVHKQIFFIGTDAIVHHQAEDIPVSYYIDIPGAAPGMQVSVTPTVEHVTYSLLDSTTLHQKVIMLFNAVVTETQLLDVEEGTEETLYYVAAVVGQGSQQLIVENAVTLSNPAQKVDEITAEVRNIVTDITTDKVVIQGILHKQIYYVGTDNVEYHQAEDVPFSLFVDVIGAAPGMNVTVTYDIEDISYTLENETELTQRVVILFTVVVTQNVQINLVEGEGDTILVEQVMAEEEGQTLLQDLVTMDRPTQKIRSIDAEVADISCYVIPDKVIIQGTIHKQIYYIGTDDVEYEQGENVDFSFFVDVPGAIPDQNCTVIPTIESVMYELQNETQMLERVVLGVSVLVTNTVPFNPTPSP